MQTFIALAAFGLLQACEVQYYPWYYFDWLVPATRRIDWSEIDQRARKAQTLLLTYSPAIKSGLVEFHKAQCFFILAIATAALVAVSQGSLNEDTISLQGLFNNYSLIGTISIGGFIPVTFILLTLHSAEMHSWYLLTLSIFAVVLSAITMFSVGDFHL